MSVSFLPNLKTGNTFLVNTHAELLNEVFGTNYQKYMKASWRCSKNAFAWIVRIDGKERSNFANTWLNEDTILQHYLGTNNMFDGKPLELDAPNDHRLVFEVIDSWRRKYIFKGVFLLNRDKSTPRDMIFQRVSDTFPMK